MNKLTEQELNNLKENLKNVYPKSKVEYLGYNRFIVSTKIQEEIEGRVVFLDKYLLFDCDLNEIQSARNYDSVYTCTLGIIIVSKNSKLNFTEDNSSSQTKKFGLIDINGKEILPCEYDRAIPKLDGLVDLSREGIEFFVPIGEITEGDFDWEDYKDYYKNRKSN